MELHEFLSLLRRKWEWLLLAVTLCASAGYVYSTSQVPEYSSTARVIIIQKSLQGSDAFIAARSSERLSIILSEVVYSNSFFNDVLATSSKITDDFGSDPARRREEWQRQVKNRINSDKGIIEISTYDRNKVQSSEILNGILKLLIENGEKYHGSSNTEIRVIDEPLTSKEPVRPNTVFNTVAAGIIAFIGALALFYLFSDNLEFYHNKTRFSIPPVKGWGEIKND